MTTALIEKIAEILCTECEGVSYASLPENVKYLECRANGGRAIADKDSARVIARLIMAEIYAELKNPNNEMIVNGYVHCYKPSSTWQAMLAASPIAPEGGKA